MALDCLRCGNCCPKDCDNFQREESGLATCRVQPEKTQHVTGYCLMSPNGLFFRGHACAAAFQRVREVCSDLDDIPTYECGRGVIAFDRSRIPDWVFKQILDER
jgi:hypothetical protein